MTAVGELFAEHGDMVYRAALRLTGSRADADDVTQELFVRLPAPRVDSREPRRLFRVGCAASPSVRRSCTSAAGGAGAR